MVVAMSTRPPTMHQAHVQQIECFITLTQELHSGGTAERLGLSQSRVSQLIAALESRVGARLVERTSRRVSLTPIGAQFEREVRPAYQGLLRTFDRARERALRGAVEELRIGFAGMVYEVIAGTFRALREQHGVAVHTHDLPLSSPFTAVLGGEVDAVIAELPGHEPELTIGFSFPPQDQLVAINADHPLAGCQALDLEDCAGVTLRHRLGDAPDYWKASLTPANTPAGTPISSPAGITSVGQGMSLVASGPHAMLVCQPLVENHQRSDIRFVPVRGFEGSSQIALVWRSDRTTPALRALVSLLDRTARPEHAAVTPSSVPARIA